MTNNPALILGGKYKIQPNYEFPYKNNLVAGFIALISLCCCHDPIRQSKELKKDSSTVVTKKDSPIVAHHPVFGYRFVITGDFDGDGKKEKLIEHYYNGIENKETNKFYDGLIDYGDLVEQASRDKTYSFVLSDNKNIDTLNIASDGRSFGLSYLKNEGDLNGDGTDEVSYVVNNADWSNLNTWHIMTYKKGQWKDLYYFAIWDW